MKLIDLMELSNYTECHFYNAKGERLEYWSNVDNKYHLYDEAKWTFEALLKKEIKSITPRNYHSFNVVLDI